MCREVHCKKELAVFPSPAGMSLIKLFLGGNNVVFSRPERVWSVTSRLGTGKWLTLFYSVGESEGAEERSRRKVGVAVQRQDVILIEEMGNRGSRRQGVEWLKVLQRQENVRVQRRVVEFEGKMVRQCRGMI